MDEVFVSYARSNEAAAIRVADALKAAGFDVWRDDRLPAHRVFSDVIEQKLQDARAVVVLWSADAVRSQWVRAEADVARSEDKIVQVSLDDAKLPLPFNQIQCTSLKNWRGKADHPGWLKVIDSVGMLVTGEAPQPRPAPVPAKWWQSPRTRWIAAACALLMFAAAFLVPQLIGGKETARPIVAVLPFESLGGSDDGLVAGIWEDTRQALSRNQQLLVLGPNTSEELAGKDSKAVRKAADYLVQASVRSAGDRVRVSANLIRTSDGVQLWSEAFERRLDDIFLLQQQIAGEIEGRIRGRLARGGGVKPEYIATSGEVYALYSDARAKVRSRQGRNFESAILQLRKVVQTDPNFAPGWATLSVANRIGRFVARKQNLRGEDTEAFARRAIALAPNLAAGHAALGLALDEGPAAEAALRRALALDPNDIEAMNWLAGVILERGQVDEALELYSRIAEIEPLWWPAIINKIELLLLRKDYRAAQQEADRLKSLGSANLHAVAEMAILRAKGDLSTATAIGIAQRKVKHSSELFSQMMPLLLQLGYEDEFAEAFGTPASVPFLLNNDPKGLDLLIEGEGLEPQDFFNRGPLAQVAARVYINSGRSAELAAMYRSVAASPNELLEVMGSRQDFASFAPLVAIAVKSAGDGDEAARLLSSAESILAASRAPEDRALLARVYAMQGRKNEAIGSLAAAVQEGWLPEPPIHVDLEVDPALALLKGDRRFEDIRQRILGHIRKERAELGPISLT